MRKQKLQTFCILLRDDDRARLDLISNTLGVSMSGTFRAALVALSRQLGFEKEFADDFMKNGNTRDI